MGNCFFLHDYDHLVAVECERTVESAHRLFVCVCNACATCEIVIPLLTAADSEEEWNLMAQAIYDSKY